MDKTYKFEIKYPSGKVRTETVIDCDTVEKFKMRHFGSVDPDEFGVEVTLAPNDEKQEAVQPPAATAPAPAATPAAVKAPDTVPTAKVEAKNVGNTALKAKTAPK